MHFDKPLYLISKPFEEGFLTVSPIHSIYFALYGNPKGTPCVVLHGGPGFGCTQSISSSLISQNGF